MIKNALAGAVMGALVLSACAPTAGPTATAMTETVQMGSNGLIVASSGLAVDFGRTQASAIASTTKLLGAPPVEVSSNADCGAGLTEIATWDAGLQLLFQDGDFRGWVATNSDFKTTGGVGPGISQDRLANAGITTKTTTLGHEFDLGGIYGLIDGREGTDRKVTTMWAGTSCFFR